MKRQIVIAVSCAVLFLAPGTSQARWMNPDKGRFQTMDTFEGNNFAPLSLHKYVYCHDDPINRIDASGKNAHLFHEYYGAAPLVGKPGHAVLVIDNPNGGIEVYGFHGLSWDLQNDFDDGPYVRFFFFDAGYVKDRHFDSVQSYVRSEQAQDHGLVLEKLAVGTGADDRRMISIMEDIRRQTLVYSIAFRQTCLERAEWWFEKYLHGEWQEKPVTWKGNGLLPSWALPGKIYENPGIFNIGPIM